MRRLLVLAALSVTVIALSACRSSSSGPEATAMPAPGSPARAVAEASQTATPAPPGGVDWPCYRGSKGDAISAESGIGKNWKAKPPKLLWKVSLGDKGFAGPSVAAGRVYIIDHDGSQDVVKALDFNSGKEIWHHSYNDTKDANYGFARSTPTFDSGKVYTLSRLGLLNCLDASAGNVIWSKDIVAEFGGRRPGWDLAASPYIDGNKLILVTGSERGTVVAVDKNKGTMIWQGGGSDKPGYATPVKATIGGKVQYVVFLATSLVGVDAENGKLLWSFPWQTQYDVNVASPLVIGNNVYISSGYGHGCAMVSVDGGHASAAWQNREMQSHISSSVLYKGAIYGIGDPGTLMCIEPKTGRATWKQDGFEKGGVCIADGVLIAMSGSNGDCVMVDPSPSGYKELGRFTPLGGQSWTAPIVSHGRLIVRNTNELACFALK